MEMRIIYVGWIGMLLVCFSFFSTALAGDSVKAPGVQVNADGSVVGVEGGGYSINKDSQTLNLKCNGEPIAVQGNNNTINCQGKSTGIAITGKGNTIHFKGTCDNLVINGAENRAEMDRIDIINANGDGNQITWVSGSSEPKPMIVSNGQGNVIKKAE